MRTVEWLGDAEFDGLWVAVGGDDPSVAFREWVGFGVEPGE